MHSSPTPENGGVPDGTDRGDPRVLLAIERTFLAWTRTALALIGFGFVVARIGLFLRDPAGAAPARGAESTLLAHSSESLWLGTALVLLGTLVQGFALLERRQFVHRFRRGESIASPGSSLSTLVAFALIGIGLALAAYLMRLI